MDNSSDSEDDFGPKPMCDANESKAKKIVKRRRLINEKEYLEALPSCARYEKSYMHRDIVTHIAVSKSTEFIVTASMDGHVKFWKKMLTGIEFVKHFQAHLAPVVGFALSADGSRLATSSTDKMIKIFDVKTYDMANIINAGFTPLCLLWLTSGSSRGGYFRQSTSHLVVSDALSPKVCIFNVDNDSQLPVHVISTLHSVPVKCMSLNSVYGMVVSIDSRGVIEYFDTDSYEIVGSGKPSVDNKFAAIQFQRKMDTDLFDLAKSKVYPVSLAVSPTGNSFAVLSSDRLLRVFDFCKGKLLRKYSEELSSYKSEGDAIPVGLSVGNAIGSSAVESLASHHSELNRRVNAEKEHEQQAVTVKDLVSRDSNGEGVANTQYYNSLNASTLCFDESGYFLIYSTLCGVKILNLLTNKVLSVLGTAEHERFLSVAIYQGVPKVDTQLLLSRSSTAAASATSVNTSNLLSGSGSSGGEKGISIANTAEQIAASSNIPDPTILCTSMGKRRFYLFSNRMPDESIEGRDILNELPTEEERRASGNVPKIQASGAVIRTKFGEIHMKLFSQECPKTIENFVTHAKSGYYDDCIFHRVIKGFMIQTGDPLGDGTGGESIWGGSFEDEIVRSLRHDRPYTVSMANAGPNTNGSQFFITTVPCPWLDGKHTVFGRVTQGFDVISKIEDLRVNKQDKPSEEVKIFSIDIV